MKLQVKPLFILNKGENAFRRPDGTREIIADERKAAERVAEISEELREALQFSGALLEDSIVQDEDQLFRLKAEIGGIDALLIYPIGMPTFTHAPLQWGLPIIAFSGQHIPTLALYAFSVERERYPHITIAVDYQDIDEALNLLEVKRMLRSTRVALFGFPPPVFSRWHHLPDFELAQQRLGVGFSAVESRDLTEQLPTIDRSEAERVAEYWRKEAKEIIEPSESDIVESARLYLALKKILAREKANALGINCLEMMSESSAAPPCYALTRLRDEGVHAACEVDIVALLTMILLGYLSDRPAFMGNIVGAIPETNMLRISHDVLPTKMAGFGDAPYPFTLRNYHFRQGVTAYVELEEGHEVIVARLARDLDKLMLLRGELIGCEDTIACRNTLSVKVSDVKEFVRRAFGQHHIIVYGNLIRQTKALCETLGIECIELL
jgi:L-fucose isomerase-like protein